MQILAITIGIFLFPTLGLACEDARVPLQVTSTVSGETARLEVITPIEYANLNLMSGAFRRQDGFVPMFGGYQEGDGSALYSVGGTVDFLKAGKIVIYYTYDPTIDFDGKESVSLCLHLETAQWQRDESN